MARVIDKKYLRTEHESRKFAGQYRFIRDAAEADLDRGKWAILGGQPSRSKATDGIKDPYLIRFEKESEHSFTESLILCHCFGYTKMVLDAYLALFSKVRKTVNWQNINQDMQDAIEENFDGQGTCLDDWFSEWFCELMVTTRAPVLVSSVEGIEYPYACIIPRENMRNWHTTAGRFQFLTYDSTHTTVTGIATKSEPSIWALTPEEIIEFSAKAGSQQLQGGDNPLQYVPVIDVEVFGGRSILKPLASMDLNLMNLDREMRKVIRNQAGMNFLVVDESVDLSKMTEKTVIKNPRGADVTKPFWANYAAGSLNDAFTYSDRLIKAIYDISRLRRQKDDIAESGIAKTIDFTNTKAVLTHISETMENSFPQIIEIFSDFMGANFSAALSIDRDFDTASADAEIDRVLKELSAQFGPTVDAHVKMKYRDTYMQLDEAAKAKSDAEILGHAENKQAAMLTGLDNLMHSHDTAGGQETEHND